MESDKPNREMNKPEMDKDSYTHDEVIEILRQVMFGGTPELYDKGGLHGNHRLRSDHTTQRAKKAFETFYLKQQKAD